MAIEKEWMISGTTVRVYGDSVVAAGKVEEILREVSRLAKSSVKCWNNDRIRKEA